LKTLTGKTVSLSVTPSDYILTVKVKIQEKEGMPANQQRLIFAGRHLEDLHTVSECTASNLKRRSTWSCA
jgi:ubiquitin